MTAVSQAAGRLPAEVLNMSDTLLMLAGWLALVILVLLFMAGARRVSRAYESVGTKGKEK